MATIDATVGDADANSYVTVAEATTYFDERLQVANWTAASADDKIRALIQATRELDKLDFEGVKSSTGQALKWPRINAFDEDLEEYDTAAIPDVVKRATHEVALVLLNANADGEDTLASSGLDQFRRAKVGPLEVEIDPAYRTARIPDPVRTMLAHVLRSAGFMSMRQRA